MYCIILHFHYYTSYDVLYTFEHYNPHKVRIVFKGNVTDKSIKTPARQGKVCELKCSSV